MNKENHILQTWLSLKEAGGLLKAKRASNILLIIGLVISILLVFSIFYRLNPIISVILSFILGWSIAERNALRIRIEMWPKLEKYLNWDVIQENCKK